MASALGASVFASFSASSSFCAFSVGEAAILSIFIGKSMLIVWVLFSAADKGGLRVA